ncbi:Uncharacterised protein [Mycobacteroides abscessus subsp. abscessus]|nr:Uncharacterised protein [Mycobacteroides abscessus subsp. abscessus]
MSANDNPALSSTFAVAGMMPVSMYNGSSPTTATECTRARGVRPRR